MSGSVANSDMPTRTLRIASTLPSSARRCRSAASIAGCVAAALTRDHVTLNTFSDEAISDRKTLAVLNKVETYIDERVRDDHEFAAVVQVETTDGRTREELVRVAPGKPQRWFTRDQLELKFMGCCSENKGVRDARRLFELVQAIDSPRPLSELARALSHGG